MTELSEARTSGDDRMKLFQPRNNEWLPQKM